MTAAVVARKAATQVRPEIPEVSNSALHWRFGLPLWGAARGAIRGRKGWV